VLTCIINRGRADVPLGSVDVRKVFNMAVDRDRIMADGRWATPTRCPR